jgi:hypothetical protein
MCASKHYCGGMEGAAGPRSTPKFMTGKHIFSFLVHSAAATAGSLFVGFVSGLLIALAISPFSAGTGNIVDRAVDSWFFRHCVDNPYFMTSILSAVCLGFMSHRFSKSQAAVWVWLLPTAVLMFNLLPSVLSSPSAAKNAWINYFSRDCGGTECLGELLVTAPFYTSLAFTFGWLTRNWLPAPERSERT